MNKLSDLQKKALQEAARDLEKGDVNDICRNILADMDKLAKIIELNPEQGRSIKNLVTEKFRNYHDSKSTALNWIRALLSSE